MAGLESNHWLKVDITLKHRELLTSKTLSFTNRAPLTDLTSTVWPLLDSVSDIGTASDRQIVLPDAGSIRLIDAQGSFGVERKFSDLLERYIVQGQQIVIYHKTTDSGDLAPSSYNTIFKGKILDWQVSANADVPVIEIRFDASIFPKRYLQLKCTASTFASLPTRNTYKTLPIVFGSNIQVKPIQIDADADNSPAYAYATTLSTTFPVGGVQKYYAKNIDGTYQQVYAASAVGTPVYSETSGTPQAANVVIANNSELAMRLPLSGTDKYVLTQFSILCYGSTAGGSGFSGATRFSIFDHDAAANRPGKEVGYCVLDKSLYGAQIALSAAFTVVGTFVKPVVLSGSTYYYFVVRNTRSSTETNSLYWREYTSHNSVTYYVRYLDAANSADWGPGVASSTQKPRINLYGCKFTDTTSSAGNDEGKGYASFEITQNAADPNFTNPDLTTLDLIVEVNGLKDDSSGTITGTVSQQINYLHHALSLLERTWSGTAWGATGNWDFTAYPDTYTAATANVYARQLAGATQGFTSFEDWARDACEAMAARIVLRKDGRLALYYWGATLTSTAVLSQENSTIEGFARLDQSYVVNRVLFGWSRTLTNFNSVNTVTEDVPADYSSLLEWKATTGAPQALLIGNSPTLYGTRGNRTTTFDWIGSTNSSEVLAKYFLTNFNDPPVFVQASMPVPDISAIELMGIVTLLHPALPAFYGSSSNTQQPQLNGSAQPMTPGFVLTRAQAYRAQIEGINLSFDADGVPSARLTTRLLLNASDPT